MKINNESGRSMVEMLGVLAIIGVLSAGALKGYSEAMFKYKMNKTIEEATKIFERFEELNQKDWGGTQEEVVYINTSDGTAVQWGLLEKCDLGSAGHCRLPIGEVYVDLLDNPSDSNGCGAPGHYGEFWFSFTSAKECIAFASVPWVQMLPQEWWNPMGYVSVFGSRRDIVLYDPNGYQGDPITTPPNIAEVTSACKSLCADGDCRIFFAYRSFNC